MTPKNNNDRIRKQLTALVGESKVLSDADTLSSRNHDFWLLDLQRRLHGSEGPTPACVVRVASHEDVVKVIAFANREGVAIVPFGAGSGVCGGARPENGAVVLDLSAMNRVKNINIYSLTVTVEPGMLGKDLEAALNARGFSMGHFPQSMNLSSVGGWVATRASGQFSTKYGSIEDMVYALKGVLADGTEIVAGGAPRSSTGPDVRELVMGSEGTFAVITEVTFKIHPLPEKQAVRALTFRYFADGLEAVRLIMRSGIKPALVRLYDASETQRHFAEYADKRESMLLLACEGPTCVALAELELARKIAMELGGDDCGEEPVKHWLGKRFDIPDVNDLAADKGVVFDTIEVSGDWDHIYDLYEAAIAGLNSVDGVLNASAHSSHSYQQGTCLYFTFAVKKPHWLRHLVTRKASLGRAKSFQDPADLAAVEETYNQCWAKVMEATLANNGCISHHHGIGKVRLPWVEADLSGSYAVLKRIKQTLDPKNVLNPGTLFKK